MIREARIYLRSEDTPAIVTAVYENKESLPYEQEEALVLPNWGDPISLALALRRSIDRFERRDRNLRGYKRAEWPAYRASNCRSVREFESHYLQIFVRAANESELFYVAHTKPHDEEEIELRVVLNRYGPDEEIGRKIRRLFDACSKWNDFVSNR
jgi:hypothetical protein